MRDGRGRTERTHPRLPLPRMFFGYLRARKKWWLAPILLFLFIFGALLALTGSPVLSPFIYALF